VSTSGGFLIGIVLGTLVAIVAWLVYRAGR
jgi:hypothetical protein